MELEHSFTVAAPVEQAWEVLLDLEQIAPCMPGASLTSHEGDEFTGTVRVKIGPVTMTFTGQGRFVERDPQARRVVVEASGKDKRGGGTARATIRAGLRPDAEQADQTTVDVHTDLVVTGRAAQFGRGMIGDVSTRLLGQFTDCLAGKLSGAPSEEATAAGDDGAGTPAVAAGPGGAAPEAPSGEAPSAGVPASAPAATAPAGGSRQAAASGAEPVEPIDLLGVTGVRAAAVRFVPYAVAFLAGALVGGGIVALVTR